VSHGKKEATARLNHTSMTAVEIIDDSLKQWKDAPVNPKLSDSNTDNRGGRQLAAM
jgi:hypothetical protein